MTTVYVIMGNDYPAAVCSKEKVADTLVKKLIKHEQKIQDTMKQQRRCCTRIHWRYYDFNLNQEPALRSIP